MGILSDHLIKCWSQAHYHLARPRSRLRGHPCLGISSLTACGSLNGLGADWPRPRGSEHGGDTILDSVWVAARTGKEGESICQPHSVRILEEALRPATGAIGTLAPTLVREIGSSVGFCPRVSVHFPCLHGSHGRAHISSMPWSEYPSSPRCDGEEHSTQDVG